MASLHIPIFFLFFSLTIFAAAVAQQPYVGLTTTDCDVQHNDSSALGYFCSAAAATCRSFLTFRAGPRYDTVADIAALFGADAAELAALNDASSELSSFAANALVLVPVNCSCSGEFYQANATYSVGADDTYFSIANNTFQAQTTCQALLNQTGNPPARSLVVGGDIAVPLRCACPTAGQNELGFRYLLSYAVAQGESVASVSERFGVSSDSVFEANSIPSDGSVYAFTNILVPLRNPPTANQTLTLAPPPPPATHVLSPSAPAEDDSKKKKTWLYALVGAIGGVALISAAIFLVFLRKKKKKTKAAEKFDEAKELALPSESFEAVEKSFSKGEKDEYSEEFLGRLSEIAQSIKVYRFEDLEAATGGFSASSLVTNSVYRGVINGDLAAIKKVDGDISDEINLLQKINHSNLIRLSGVAFSEGFWYLVYEYASNGPLSEWIHNDNGPNPNPKSLTWTQKIQIALDVATGLDYLHSFVTPSLVHKDIKSENVLLDADLRGKIGSLGLARSTTAQEGGQDGHFSVTRHIIGTRGYMSPEYLEHGIVSTKLDVYSFGVLLLEILTGKDISAISLELENRSLSEAFGGEVREAGLRSFIDASIGEDRPVELVGYVVKIVGGCLKKNPEARPSMGEIVQLLSLTLSNSRTGESSKMS